jgi:hypothetical protein
MSRIVAGRSVVCRNRNPSFRGRGGRSSVRRLAEMALSVDLRRTRGYLVADSRGRMIGKVECPLYGASRDMPDSLAVARGFVFRRRRLVPARAIQVVDSSSGVIGLRVGRDEITSF